MGKAHLREHGREKGSGGIERELDELRATARAFIPGTLECGIRLAKAQHLADFDRKRETNRKK